MEVAVEVAEGAANHDAGHDDSEGASRALGDR